jgi:four helix bundle protein
MVTAGIRSGMSDYKRLRVWRKAHSLALNAHHAAMLIRGAHYSAFRSQIIRAALSIPANIVEGREQQSEAGFARFIRIALASTSELEYDLIAARDIHAIGEREFVALSSQVEEVRMMLHGLLSSLKTTQNLTRASRTDVPA